MTKHAYSLDAFRVIAILWVFLTHLLFFNEGLAESDKISPYICDTITHVCMFAVHFFIVLSSFLVGYSYEKSIGHGYWEYLKKRAKRLLPLNMITVPFYAILLIWMGLYVFSWSKTIPNFILASLLLQEMFRFSSLSFNVPAWTISTLFIFYLLTPLLILSLKKIRNPWMLIILVIFFTVADLEYRNWLLEMKPNNTWINYVSPINRILSYMIGLTLGYTVKVSVCPETIRRYINWMEITIFGFVIYGLSLIESSCTIGFYSVGIYILSCTVPALIVLCYVEKGRITRMIAASKINKASPYVYAFYMSHFFFILLVYAICDKVLGIWGSMSMMQVPYMVVVTFIGACAASVLLHHCVEKRIA